MTTKFASNHDNLLVAALHNEADSTLVFSVTLKCAKLCYTLTASWRDVHTNCQLDWQLRSNIKQSYLEKVSS